MRILMVGAISVRSSDAALLLKEAFERQGGKVRFVGLPDDIPFWTQVARTLPGNHTRIVAFSRYFLKRAFEWGPDVVYLHGSNNWILPSAICRLKRKLGCQVVLWELNQQQLKHGYQAECVPLYDHVFVLDSYMVPVLQIAGAQAVHHLCACADPSEHGRVALTLQERERYGAEISFVGSGHPKRARYLAHLVHHDLKVYGVGWEDTCEELAACVRSEPVYGLKKTQIYSASKMSLNIESPHIINAVNFRAFEVAMCGSVSIAEPRPDLLDCFESDEEVILFKDAESLRKKVDYYLAHPDELERIGEAARQRVLAEHTYDHRVETILSALSAADSAGAI